MAAEEPLVKAGYSLLTSAEPVDETSHFRKHPEPVELLPKISTLLHSKTLTTTTLVEFIILL